MQLHESVDISSSIYCCPYECPFDQYRLRNVKKELQHYFLANVFNHVFVVCGKFLCFHVRLLTGQYAIIAPWFIVCNYTVEKCIHLFFESKRDLFCKWQHVQLVVQQPASAISSEHIFLIFQFFVMIFWTVPYVTFTWLVILDNLAMRSLWVILSTLSSRSHLWQKSVFLNDFHRRYSCVHFWIFCTIFSHVEHWLWIYHKHSWSFNKCQ